MSLAVEHPSLHPGAPECDARPDLAIGTVLTETYELRALLGTGGMGQVYEAHDRLLERRVAIKIARSTSSGEVLRHEGEALAAIHHPSVVKVYGMASHERMPYLVMEYVGGVSLAHELEQRARRQERFTIPETVGVLAAIAEALDRVSAAGVAHCDLKPANVMLAPGDRIVLIDFGIRVAEVDVETISDVAGSPPYIAPEAILHDVSPGSAHLVDLYALGVIAYEMLVGTLPMLGRSATETLQMHLFRDAPDVREARPEVPAALASLVRELLARDPSQRTPSAADALSRLRGVGSERTSAPRATPTFSAPDRPLADAGTPDTSHARACDSRERLSSAAIARIVQPRDLRVVFQPIVDLWTLRPFAYEALVRCALPRFRDPTELFRDAAENDCAGLLGRMIREITFPLAPGVRLFVNVHPAELDARWLVRPDDPLFSHDQEVYLEITEAVPLPSASRYAEVLREMRLRGQVHVVVDDLGSGYSNLQWLVDLQPEVAKLDMRLVHGVDHDRRQRRLVAGIVRLCADLDLTVVAEGIETVPQACALRDLGVRYAQGFLFARPAFPLPVVDAAVLTDG